MQHFPVDKKHENLFATEQMQQIYLESRPCNSCRSNIGKCGKISFSFDARHFRQSVVCNGWHNIRTKKFITIFHHHRHHHHHSQHPHHHHHTQFSSYFIIMKMIDGYLNVIVIAIILNIVKIQGYDGIYHYYHETSNKVCVLSLSFFLKDKLIFINCDYIWNC